MDEPKPGAGAVEVVGERPDDAIEPDMELPVVARLVVEIRSDGTRTVARSAIQDLETGQDLALEVRSGSPLELSRSLVKLLLQTPALARTAARRLVPRPRLLGRWRDRSRERR